MNNHSLIFIKHNLCPGNLICHSKSYYRQQYPNNKVYFNANIFTKHGKVWYGDIDLSSPHKLALQSIADELGEDMYILTEMLGRFQCEHRPLEELKKLAVEIIYANVGKPSLHQTVVMASGKFS